MFLKLFSILMGLTFISAVLFGQAAGLVIGIIGTVIWFCCGEAQRMNTSEGRKQIRNQYEREKKIEEYWGTIEYWEDK